MTVYLISCGEHSDYEILGIFSTRAKAEKAVVDYERPRAVEWQDEPYRYRANPIYEIALDSWVSDELRDFAAGITDVRPA